MTQKMIYPLGDRVIVQELKNEVKRSAAGIIIPETVTASDVKIAKVIAVGPGLYTQNGVTIPMSVKVGDEVILPPYHQGHEIKIEKETFIAVRESELIAILNSSEKADLDLSF